MPPITTREELMDKIHTTRRRLENNIARLPTELIERPGLVENGWSGKDILAHLAEWQERYLGWLKKAQKGKIPETPAPGFSWKPPDMDRLNKLIYETHRDMPLDEVLAYFRRVFAAFVQVAEGLSDEELFTPGYYSFTGKRRQYDWLREYASHDAWGQRFIRKLNREAAPKRARSRAEIIARLYAERRRLEKNLGELSPADLEVPNAIGKWRLADLLTHLAAWEALLKPWVEASLRGEQVKTPAPDLGWDQLDIFNERLYQQHKDKSAAEALRFFDEAHAEFMALVEGMSEEDILTPGVYNLTGGGELYGWLVAYAEHDRWGKGEIRGWLKRK